MAFTVDAFLGSLSVLMLNYERVTQFKTSITERLLHTASPNLFNTVFFHIYGLILNNLAAFSAAQTLQKVCKI